MMGAWFGVGDEMSAAGEAASIVSPVAEDSSPAESAFSIPSRTPSMVSINSAFTTMEPKPVTAWQVLFGPQFRELMR